VQRHYSRYVDDVNRQETGTAFETVMTEGRQISLSTNITLISNDFVFGIGAQLPQHDILTRMIMTLYPRYNKHGAVCGVVFEAINISGEKLMADLYKYVLSKNGEPLVYNSAEDEERYNTDALECRTHHGPIIAIQDNLLRPDDRFIVDCTHAAMLKLKMDPTTRDQILGHDLEEFLHPDSVHKFAQYVQDVRKTKMPYMVDLWVKMGDKFTPMPLTLSPWYDQNGRSQGIIVGLEGELAGFSVDSDGYITDCTDAVVNHLGFDKQDIVGFELMRFVDSDSVWTVHGNIMELFEEDDDLDLVRSKCFLDLVLTPCVAGW
jgi:hypothetical protein